MRTKNNPLHRSKSAKLIGGVCGGMAEWLGWNPTLVRLLFVLVYVMERQLLPQLEELDLTLFHGTEHQQ